MTSMISSPNPNTSGGFSQNDLFRGFSSIGNRVRQKERNKKIIP
jgi:hypothetical protein